MIHSIEIENFQSHKHSTISLSSGVNALVGNSDCGKSAVLRALCWAILNSPSGDAHLSYWIKTKSGGIKTGASCEVTVTVGDHDGKADVSRVRSSSFNGYRLYTGGDQANLFEALRTDVPVQVSKTLNLGTVNIQRQLDGPFLLSSTPGEVARYINSLVNLTKIDEYQSAVASKLLDLGKTRKMLEADVAAASKQVEDFAWVDDAEALVNDAVALEAKAAELAQEVRNLSCEIVQYQSTSDTLKSCSSVLEKLIPLLDSLPVLYTKQVETDKQIRGIRDSICNHTSLILVIQSYPCGLETGIRVLEDLKVKYDRTSEQLQLLDSNVVKHRQLCGSVPNALEDIESSISRMERLNRIISVSRTNISDLSKTLERHSILSKEHITADVDLKGILTDLSTKQCPLCGHIGCVL